MIKEEELVKELKDSFPDMLEFNNCLKGLRKFWKGQGRQEQKKEDIEEEIKFLEWEIAEDDFSNMMQEVCSRRTKLLEKLKQEIKGEK